MKKFVFTPLDLIAPWLICLASAGLCAWGAVVATGPGRWVSAATGVVFLLGIVAFYVIRYGYRLPDFVTAEGVAIVWGHQNKPSKELVEMWIKGLKDFWTSKVVQPVHEPISAQLTVTPWAIERALKDLTVICYDADHFSFWGRMVTGYAYGKDIGIGFKGVDMNYTASLFRHEVSHHILDAVGVIWDEERHHRVFKDVGLGA